MGNLLRCEECGCIIDPIRTTEEAEAEAEQLYGVKHASTNPYMAVVCDDCFQVIMKRVKGQSA